MFAAVDLSGTRIEGIRVYTCLPTSTFVDLEKESINPIGGEIDPFDYDTLDSIIDDVVESGKLPSGISWGRTSRNEYGYADVLVDSAEVNADIVRELIIAGVITKKAA